MTPFDPRLPVVAKQAGVKTCHVFHCWSAIRETGAAFHVAAFAAFAGLEEKHVTSMMAAMDAHSVLPKRRATVRPKAVVGDNPIAQQVITAWNSQKGLTPSRGLDENRQKHLDARVKAHGEQSVFDAIRRIGASAWHCGSNDRGWKADLGWLLSSPEKFLKALELPDPQEPVQSKAMTETEIRRAIEFNRAQGNDARVAELQSMLSGNVIPFKATA